MTMASEGRAVARTMGAALATLPGVRGRRGESRPAGVLTIAADDGPVIISRIAGSPDRRIAGSPDRRIAGSPDRRIAGSPHLRARDGHEYSRMAAPVGPPVLLPA